MAAFVNAQVRKAESPDTFFAPELDDLELIRVGDSVKVGVDGSQGSPGERFWVEVTGIDGDQITGTVDNDLLMTKMHGLYFGKEVTFSKACVYNIVGVEVRA